MKKIDQGIKQLKNKIKDIFSKVIWIKILKKSKNFIVSYRMYFFMFISLYILDISTRIATNSIDFIDYMDRIPNLFSCFWLLFLILLVRNLKNIYGKLLYGLFFAFHFIMFLVNNLYYIYFKIFFDFSVLDAASEGSSYLLDTLKDISFWMYLVMLISLFFMGLTFKYFNQNKKNNLPYLTIIVAFFTVMHFILPLTLGEATTELEWDAWSNKRNIYNSFNDNNKSMQLVGLFEYNFRNIYVSYMRQEVSDDSETLSFLDEIFKAEEEKHYNQYTGLFEGKNLILVQMEGIDKFLTNESIMPNLVSLRNNSINFLNHYSFVNGGGSTFNSEFMVNTGYSTPYSYNQNAYTFSKNDFSYSLPNLFKSIGYTVNAFHMNSSEYYSRGVNYKNFGYNSYNGLKDLGIYKNKEFQLDRELLLNEEFNSKIFNVENTINANFVSSIITYSAHTPFNQTKGVCHMLLSEEEKNDPNLLLTEYDCLKRQAKETDDMIGLLIENLKEKDLYDSTVIVFYTDHYLYTLSDKTLLDTYKDTSSNLINHTDFFIWSSDINYTEVTKVTSQLNILPTILNLFNLYSHPTYYVGSDALDDEYPGFVFFQDYSWYDGKRYVNSNGEIISGLNATDDYIFYMSNKINELIKKNDEVLKYDYFKYIQDEDEKLEE